MTLVAEVVLGLVAVLYLGWTILGFKMARRASGKDVAILYRQTVTYAVFAAAFAGLAWSLRFDGSAFRYAMCALIAMAAVFKWFNIRRLPLATRMPD